MPREDDPAERALADSPRRSNDVSPAVSGKPDDKISVRAVRSVRWSAISRLAIQLTQFASQIALARILAPAEFGVAATALVVANFALLVSDLGLGAALIHSSRHSDGRNDTAFWINALTGFALAGFIIALASPLSESLGQPRAAGPLMLAGLACALALYTVPIALLERRLELRLAGIIEAVSAVMSSGIGIAAAAAGAGAFAVVLIPVSSVALSSVLFLVMSGYRPRGFIDRHEAIDILRFVRGLVGFNVINYFTRNTDNVLLARQGTAEALGFYTRAFSLMLLPVAQIQTVVGRVLFPALARLQGDLPRLMSAHRRALLVSASLCAPLSVGVAITSPDLVLTLFGSAWSPMAPLLTILSFTGVQQVVQGTVGTLYQAVGRTDLMFKWNLLFTAITIAAFFVGIHWGALGLCWAVFIRGWVLLPITMMVPLHLIGDRFRDVAKMLGPLVVCLLVEGLVVWGVVAMSGELVESAVVRLVIEVAVGGAAYLICVRVFLPNVLREILSIVGVSRRRVAQ